MRPMPWTLRYADGSGNAYAFEGLSPQAPVRFEYVPVTPEQSSTGSYSGGDPVRAELAPTDPRLDELWRRVETFEADPSLHTDLRAKGSGAFGVITSASERQFIVHQGAELTGFDAFVKTFRR